MLVNGLENKLNLTPRDAEAMGFEPYLNDESQGIVNNLILNLTEQLVLIPTREYLLLPQRN
jgi:hypothetical protein